MRRERKFLSQLLIELAYWVMPEGESKRHLSRGLLVWTSYEVDLIRKKKVRG